MKTESEKTNSHYNKVDPRRRSITSSWEGEVHMARKTREPPTDILEQCVETIHGENTRAGGKTDARTWAPFDVELDRIIGHGLEFRGDSTRSRPELPRGDGGNEAGVMGWP